MDQHHRCPPPLASATPAPASCSIIWQPKEETAATPAAAAAEELKQAFLRTTLELQSTRNAAQEELRRMEYQALHLTGLLETATRERDEARHALLLLLHQADLRPRVSIDSNPSSAPSLAALDEGRDVAAAGEDLEDSYNGAYYPAVAEVETTAAKRGLPEKGRLVEAVMEAGPLLQTLMLAGPLPQWRHPPPELEGSEIPPVDISLKPKRERNGGDGPPSPTSLWNSSSSSSPERDNNSSHRGGKFQNVTLTLKNM